MSKILRSQWSHIFKVWQQQITIHSVWLLQSTKVHIHIHVHMQNAWNKRHWIISQKTHSKIKHQSLKQILIFGKTYYSEYTQNKFIYQLYVPKMFYIARTESRLLSNTDESGECVFAIWRESSDLNPVITSSHPATLCGLHKCNTSRDVVSRLWVLVSRLIEDKKGGRGCGLECQVLVLIKSRHFQDLNK